MNVCSIPACRAIVRTTALTFMATRVPAYDVPAYAVPAYDVPASDVFA